MPNWIGPVVTVGVVAFGYIAWLVWQNIKGQIREEIRAGVTKVLDEVAELKGDVREARTERKGDLELNHVKFGQLGTMLDRHDRRISDVERVLGQSTNLREFKG
jgi:hypothetical protein